VAGLFLLFLGKNARQYTTLALFAQKGKIYLRINTQPSPV
jgi:hypothetical protein